jgi:hypothetical protein
MLKIAIAATVSISCYLFLSNIAEAKQPTVNKRLNQNLSCESQTNTIAQSNVISTADIRAICTIITNKYRENNERGKNTEYNPGNKTGHAFLAWEAKKLSLVSDSSSANYAEIEIQYIRRDYKYWSNVWHMEREDAESQIVVFHKKGAKWDYERTIRSGMMGLG